MKKILTVLIVMALLVAAFTLVSCEKEEEVGHVHSFKATVVKPTCSLEGYTEYVCSGCDYVYRDSVVPANGKNHTFKEFTEKPATCTEKGVKVKECTGCGERIESAIAVKKHTYDEANAVVVLAPTCTETGIKENQCINCDNVKKDTLKALGHSYGDWIVDYAPQCDGQYGYQHHICEACGHEEGEEILPHVSSTAGTKTAPTCCEVGYTTYVCDLCGEIYDRDFVKATGKHNFGDWYAVEGYANLQRRDCKYCEYYEVKETK